jgi:hypothetical protein
MTAFIVPEADAVGRTTTERTDTDLLILSREMNVREKQKRNKTFNSARILDNALQRALVPRFNLIAAMEGGNGR